VGGVPSTQDCELISVLVIFYHAEFDVFLEIFPKFVESINLFIIGAFEFSISLCAFFLLFREQFLLFLRIGVEGN
jgi:hypothetical protein